MAWTQAEIDALKKAMAKGVLSVAFADRTVTYRSVAEMQAVLAMMEREVAGANAVTHRLAAHRKGV